MSLKSPIVEFESGFGCLVSWSLVCWLASGSSPNSGAFCAFRSLCGALRRFCWCHHARNPIFFVQQSHFVIIYDSESPNLCLLQKRNKKYQVNSLLIIFQWVFVSNRNLYQENQRGGKSKLTEINFFPQLPQVGLDFGGFRAVLDHIFLQLIYLRHDLIFFRDNQSTNFSAWKIFPASMNSVWKQTRFLESCAHSDPRVRDAPCAPHHQNDSRP